MNILYEILKNKPSPEPPSPPPHSPPLTLPPPSLPPSLSLVRPLHIEAYDIYASICILNLTHEKSKFMVASWFYLWFLTRIFISVIGIIYCLRVCLVRLYHIYINICTYSSFNTNKIINTWMKTIEFIFLFQK